MPASDRSDDEDEDEESEDESSDEEGEEAPKKDEDTPEAAAKKLEQLRLHKALGNDGLPGQELPEEPEEEYEISDSESSSGVSDAGTDYTQYLRPARAPRVRPSVAAVSQLGGIDELRTIVSADLQREQRSSARHHTKRVGAGKAKGSKWKSNAAYLTGKKGNSGWD